MSKRNPYTAVGRTGRLTHRRYPATVKASNIRTDKAARSQRPKERPAEYLGGTFQQVPAVS